MWSFQGAWPLRHAGVLRASIQVRCRRRWARRHDGAANGLCLDFSGLSAPLVSVEPFVDQGMSHCFRLLTVAVYDFSGHFNVPRMDRYDPLVSLNPSADGISYTSVLHRDMLHSNSKLGNALRRPGDAPNLASKANICPGSSGRDASVISSEHGDSLLRFLDLPVHQLAKVCSSISRRPEGAPSRCISSINW